LLEKLWVSVITFALLFITFTGVVRPKIVAEYKVDKIPNATAIYSGITGKIGGRNYLFAGMAIQEKKPSSGILIFDIQNPSRPVQIAFLKYPDENNYWGLMLKDNIFFARCSNYLQILDVSVPSSSREIARIDIINPQLVTCSGKYAYIYSRVDNEYNITAADISLPESPVIVSTWKFSQPIRKMIAAGDKLLLFAGDVHIVDISSPPSLREISHITSPGMPRIHVSGIFSDIGVSGQYLYVGASENGMLVFDIADPANPRKIAEIAGPKYQVRYILVKGKLVCLLGDQAVYFIDVSNPAKPKKIGLVNLPYNPHSSEYGYFGITEANNFLYIPTQIGIEVQKNAIKIIDATAFRGKW
jgi:hypothetical protein